MLLTMRAQHVLAVFSAACLISLCSPVRSLSSTHEANVEGRISFPEGQAPPVSLVKVSAFLTRRTPVMQHDLLYTTH